MIPILYATVTEGTVPTDYGLGALTDCLACQVTEERNGAYELQLEYASGGIHAEDLQVNRFIKAKPNFTDNEQLFRIYKIGKTMNGRFTVYAQHISYDLSGKLITTGTAGSITAACTLLTASAGNFVVDSDKNTVGDFEVLEPSSVRSWFGGKTGSLLDVYGTGEWHYDNYTCTLKATRGADRNVQIRYGKNLTELSQEINIENLATGVLPYCVDDSGNKTIGTLVSTGLVFDVDRDIAVDFSDSVDFESSTPLATQLSTIATAYVTNNNFVTGLQNIELDFVQLSDLTERVDLCDTVHIYFEPLGISASLKCIKTTWDVLKDRYTACEFGDSKTNIADTIVTQAKKIDEKPSASVMHDAIDHATELITGNLGGYVLLHDANGDGYPDELLILDNQSGGDISQAVDVWRWNKAGLGHSGNGYSGPYDSVAITYDGKISATAITTGVLNANLIKAGFIEDVNHNSQIDMTSGVATLKNMKSKESLELIDENGIKRGFFKYESGAGEPHLAIVDADEDILAEMWGIAEGGRVRVNNLSGSERALMSTLYDRGYIRLRDENNKVRVYLYGNGGIEIDDANGDVLINLDGGNNRIELPTGHIKAPNTFDKVYDNNVNPALSTVGAWWTFSTDFAGLLIVGKVVSTGSRTTTIIPIEMLNATPTRFFLSDESNFISFDCSVDNGLAKVEIAAKSSTGFIEKVYGMF